MSVSDVAAHPTVAGDGVEVMMEVMGLEPHDFYVSKESRASLESGYTTKALGTALLLLDHAPSAGVR